MKKLPVITFAALCVLIFAGSCNVDNSSTTNPQFGAFLIANVSPDAPPLTVYINNSLFGAGLNYGNYTPYYRATPGSYTFSFYDSSSSSSPKLTKTVEISPLVNYSFFVVDSFSKVKSSFVTDAYAIPGGDSVSVRFFNFSPNAGAVSLIDSASNTTLFNNRSFNDQDGNSLYSTFNEVETGTSAVYHLQLKQSDGTVIASRTDTLSGGHVYTFFAKGNVGGTGTQAVGIGRIQSF